MIKWNYDNPTGRHKSGANTAGGRGTLRRRLGENQFEHFERYQDDTVIQYYYITISQYHGAPFVVDSVRIILVCIRLKS